MQKTQVNPFDDAFLGIETPDEPSTAKFTFRLPKRWLDLTMELSNSPKLPFAGSASALVRTAIIRYLKQVAEQIGEAEMSLYLAGISRLRHGAFKHTIEFETRRYMAAYEQALTEATTRKRWTAVHELLREIYAFIDTAPSEEWKADLALIVAGSKAVREAVIGIIGAWHEDGNAGHKLAATNWHIVASKGWYNVNS